MAWLAGSGQKPNDFSGLAVDEGSDIARDAFRRRFDRVGSEVGVARGGLDLSVPEQLADHGQALAEGHGARSERMTQVVDAHVREPGREIQILLLRRGEALVIGGLAAELALKPMDQVAAWRCLAARAQSRTVARLRKRCHGGCRSVLRAPGFLPQMTQGLSGRRSILESTSSAGAPRWMTRAPVLESGSRRHRASKST